MFNEKELVNRIRKGDKAAFRDLVEWLKKDVYNMAYRLTGNHNDADDLSQNVFIKFYKSIDQYRHESQIKSWLFKIAVNDFIDKKRKKINTIIVPFKQEENQTSHPENNYKSDKTNPEENTEAVLIKAHIDQALTKLSPKEKSAFIIKDFQGQSIREIASVFETTEGTVKSLLFRGIKKLQQALAYYRPELGLKETDG